MDIFSIFQLLGGLAFFLYGMNTMSSGLEKMTGGKLEKLLNKMTEKPFMGFLLGIGITVAIQSSSALTVMLVGLVNSGVMQFSQTVSIIMGSNVGTTLTAWLLSLAGINSDNFLINMLKPSSFAPLLALAGIIMMMAAKRQHRKDIGNILLGFSVLMFGMTQMSDAMSPLADMPEFTSILVAFNNPLLGVLVGAVFTGIIQSSAASVGILQALSLTGGVTFNMAIPLIMGQNIGTCVTSVISSIGVNRNAKRVAALHISFNIIGTVICLSLYYLVSAFVHLTFGETPITPVGIAMVHSVFNVATTAILYPFQKLLVRIAEKLVPGKYEEEEMRILVDERLLKTPSFAISECNSVTVDMAGLASRAMLRSMELLNAYDDKKAESVRHDENLVDKYEDTLSTFLVQLSSKDLSEGDSKQVSKILHTIGDFERISDHAVNMVETSLEIFEKKIIFSAEATKEIETCRAAVQEIVEMTTKAFQMNDLALAAKVEPLEQVIDGLIRTTKENHITRLQSGRCTIEMGFVLSDMMTDFERVSDHCSNIAVAIIEVAQNTFDTHAYLHEIRADDDNFRNMYNEYKHKFHIA